MFFARPRQGAPPPWAGARPSPRCRAGSRPASAPRHWLVKRAPTGC